MSNFTSRDLADLINQKTKVKVTRRAIKQVFLDTSLIYGHKGLTAIARKEGIDPQTLLEGEYLVFINKAKTAVKMLAGYGTTMAHLKMPKDAKLNLQTVKYFPKFFGGGEINYLGALKEVFK